MFRIVSAVSRSLRFVESSLTRYGTKALPQFTTKQPSQSKCQQIMPFSHFITKQPPLACLSYSKFNGPLVSILAPNVRTLTKFSLKKGKRKSVKPVIRRFYRLNWGIWIRTKAGRQKHLWRKTPQRKRRLRQHVFCNATQSTLLDKMVTNFWKRPRYYVDDPYEPYHKREEFIYTRRKPI